MRKINFIFLLLAFAIASCSPQQIPGSLDTTPTISAPSGHFIIVSYPLFAEEGFAISYEVMPSEEVTCVDDLGMTGTGNKFQNLIVMGQTNIVNQIQCTFGDGTVITDTMTVIFSNESAIDIKYDEVYDGFNGAGPSCDFGAQGISSLNLKIGNVTFNVSPNLTDSLLSVQDSLNQIDIPQYTAQSLYGENINGKRSLTINVAYCFGAVQAHIVVKTKN